MLSKFNDAFKIEETTDFLYDIVDCFSFEISAIAKVSERIIKSPWFLGQQIFWNNFKKFLCGIKSDPEFEAKFATKITNSPKRNNYAIKIIKTIDDIDDEEKVDWIINATRSLCWDNISLLSCLWHIWTTESMDSLNSPHRQSYLCVLCFHLQLRCISGRFFDKRKYRPI